MDPSERLHDLLRDTPEPPPPASLWPQLLERRRRQIRLRRLVTGIASTGVATVLVMVLAWPDRLAQPGPPTDQAAAGPGLAAQVRALDHALQVAYDRGASDSEVAPLWEARQALLLGGGDGNAGPDRVNDI